MGMNLFTGEGKTKRCLLQEARCHDLETISSILKDNLDAIRLQGEDEQPTKLAQSLIDYSDLPPQGQPFTKIVGDNNCSGTTYADVELVKRKLIGK